jgi:hypothetical protein
MATAPPVWVFPAEALFPPIAVFPPVPVRPPVALAPPAALEPPVALAPPAALEPPVTLAPPAAGVPPVALIPPALFFGAGSFEPHPNIPKATARTNDFLRLSISSSAWTLGLDAKTIRHGRTSRFSRV